MLAGEGMAEDADEIKVARWLGILLELADEDMNFFGQMKLSQISLTRFVWL